MSVTVDYLIPILRLRIGDTNEATYRYLDEWLTVSLVLAIKNLSRFWRDKYIVNSDDSISRNTYYTNFVQDESDGVIEKRDEYIIVLMAAIIILEGSLENSAWSTASWADAEVRYTNIDGTRIREANIKRMVEELNSLILPPVKRLARPTKGHLPGYRNNTYES